MTLVRYATERDVAAITEIYAHHVRTGTATFEIDPPDSAEMDRRRLEILSYSLPYLVAEMDGMVAGYAYAGRYRPRPAYRFTVEDSIYIHHAFLARGLGQLLLQQLIELCRANGRSQMIAVIGDTANVASVRLHAKFGFRTVGTLERVGRKFGRWIDTVLMQCELAADDRLSKLKQVVERVKASSTALQDIADFLRRTGNYRWVGLYEVDHSNGEVRNLVFSGPGAPAHPVFSIGNGLTASAIRERRTVNVGDVLADPRYLTAFGTTRSEIIVPVFDKSNNAVIGTIDIESDAIEAFSEEDQIFLEDSAGIIRPFWNR